MAENKYTQSIERAKLDLEQIEKSVLDIGKAISQLDTSLIQKMNKTFAKTPQGFKKQMDSVQKSIAAVSKEMNKQAKLQKEREEAIKREADLQYKFSKDRESQEKWQMRQMEKAGRIRRNHNADKEKEARASEKAAQAAKKQAEANARLNTAYAKLVANQKRARNALRELIASEKASKNEIRAVQKEYDKYTAKVNKANGATRNFAKGGLGSAVMGLRNLAAAFGFVGGLYIFADMAKQGFKLAKQLDSLNFAMKTVITDSNELARTQTFLADITERYGAEVVTTTERYTKFLAAAKQSNVTLEDTEQIFGTMTKAAGALGLKTHELEGVYLALEQMLSKGKVTTEELRRQLGERLPGAFGIMAKAVGVSVGELDGMLRKGEILAADVLPKFAKEVEKAYGIDQLNRVENLNAATARMSNAWVEFVGNITKSEGAVSNSLIFILDSFTSLVDTVKELNNTLENSILFGKTSGRSEMTKILKQDVDELGHSMKRAAEVRLPGLIAQLESYESKLRELQEQSRDDLDAYTLFDKLLGKISDNRVNKTAEMVEKYREMVRVAKEAAGELAENDVFGPVRNPEQEESFSLIDEHYKSSKAGRTYADVMAEITEQQELLKNSTAEEAGAINKKISLLKEEAKSWELSNDKRKESKEIIEGTVQAMEEQIAALKEQRDEVATTKERYNELNEEIEGLEKTLKRFQEGTEGLEILIGGSVDTGDFGKDLDQSDLLDSAAERMQMEVDLENQKMEAIKAIREGGLEHYEHLNEQQIESVEKAIAYQKELGRDLYDSLTDVGSNFLDARVDQIDEEIALNREKYAEILNSQELSEEQRSAIEAERDAREAELEKKKRKREEQAFFFKQGLALAEIGINLAQTISNINTMAHTLPPGAAEAYKAANIPLAIGVAGAQTAAVLAQTIPKFEKGTENAPEGLAIIDEKRPEVHMDKHGNIKSFGSEGGARLTYTEKGDVIKPSHDKFFDMVGYDEMQKAVFQMNMASNGEQLSRHKVDNSLLSSVNDLKSSNEKVWKEVKKLASRPIHNNVNVTVKEDSAY